MSSYRWSKTQNCWYHFMFNKVQPLSEPVETRAYFGKVACPKCESKRTFSDCIATSSRWMDFYCDDCKHKFRKAAASVSSLSARLRGTTETLNKIADKELKD